MKDVKDNLDSKMYKDLLKEIVESIYVVEASIRTRADMEPLRTLPYNPDIQ